MTVIFFFIPDTIRGHAIQIPVTKPAIIPDQQIPVTKPAIIPDQQIPVTTPATIPDQQIRVPKLAMKPGQQSLVTKPTIKPDQQTLVTKPAITPGQQILPTKPAKLPYKIGQPTTLFPKIPIAHITLPGISKLQLSTLIKNGGKAHEINLESPQLRSNIWKKTGHRIGPYLTRMNKAYVASALREEPKTTVVVSPQIRKNIWGLQKKSDVVRSYLL